MATRIVCGSGKFKTKYAKKYANAIADQLQHAIENDGIKYENKEAIVCIDLTFVDKFGKKLSKKKGK